MIASRVRLGRAIKALEGAKGLLAKKGAWTKNHYAKDKYGTGVSPRSKKAVQFCAYGALEAKTTSYYTRVAAERLFMEANNRGMVGLNDFDAKSKRDVLSAFTKAIKLGKKHLSKVS